MNINDNLVGTVSLADRSSFQTLPSRTTGAGSRHEPELFKAYAALPQATLGDVCVKAELASVHFAAGKSPPRQSSRPNLADWTKNDTQFHAIIIRTMAGERKLHRVMFSATKLGGKALAEFLYPVQFLDSRHYWAYQENIVEIVIT